MQLWAPVNRTTCSGVAIGLRAVAVLGLVAGLALFAACRQVEPGSMPDSETVRRPTWWNFYSRGCSRSLREDWIQARQDFEIALGYQRGAVYGATEEKWRAKTYGLHFLDNYFPHRELGICLFHLDNLAAAEQELLKSLEQQPSSRAKHYLNLTRQAVLRKSGAQVQPGPLRIELDLPPGERLFLAEPQLALKGTIRSPARVAKVSINGEPVFMELAETDFRFDRRITLAPGAQELRVVAEDLAGKQSVWARPVTLDDQGPSISVAAAVDADGKACSRIQVADNCELGSLAVNGKARELKPGQAAYQEDRPLAELATLSVTATDRAGNQTRFESAVPGLRKAAIDRPFRDAPRVQLADARLYGHPLPAAAQASSRVANSGAAEFQAEPQGTVHRPPSTVHPSPYQVPGPQSPVPSSRLASDQPIRLLAAKDATPAPPKADTADTMPPALTLRPEIAERLAVTTPYFFLEGQVQDGGGIASVTVELNGQAEPWKLPEAKPQVVCFSRKLKLQKGDNQLRIKATDASGNVTEKTAVVAWQESNLTRTDLRLKLLCLPPGVENLAGLQSLDISDFMLEAFLLEPSRLNLLARDRRVLESLLLEHKLAASDLADRNKAISAGKMKTADLVLYGNINRWSGQDGKDHHDLTAFLVDVETGEIMLPVDVYLTSLNRDYVRSQISGLVEKLCQQLPLLEAKAQPRKNGSCLVDVGKEQGVRVGMKFVFVPAEDDANLDAPRTQETKDAEGRPVAKTIEGKVTTVENARALLEITPKDSAAALKPGDHAITR